MGITVRRKFTSTKSSSTLFLFVSIWVDAIDFDHRRAFGKISGDNDLFKR